MVECKNCKYCKDRRGYGNTRGSFHCEHPNQSYIYDYFKEHKISKMSGFIGFGAKYSPIPLVKSSPKWCPIRVEVQDEK